MIDIYTYDKKCEFELLCHTSLGDPFDVHGRYYEKGKKYIATLEPRGICGKDSNYEVFTSMWVHHNNKFGGRFAVVGNIYDNGKPYWDDFRKYFYCPIEKERKDKILRIKNLINSK